MSEYPQHHLPQIPLVNSTSSLEQLGGGILLSRLILGPSVTPISSSIVALELLLLVQFPASVGHESRENENRFDAKFFERA